MDGNTPPAPQVMASVVAEFESIEACKNAVGGLVQLGKVTGFEVNGMCAPKDIAKLEVERPPKKRDSVPRMGEKAS